MPILSFIKDIIGIKLSSMKDKSTQKEFYWESNHNY